MKLPQNRQKNNSDNSTTIELPRGHKGCRRIAISAIRSSVVKKIYGKEPNVTEPFPCWQIGELEVAFCDPTQSLFPNRWTLDIWTPEKKVLNISWPSDNEKDIEIVSFRRGDWERIGVIK